MKKKVLCCFLAATMVATMFTGCGSKKDDKGSVYFLNFKPEVDEQWQALAKAYTEETGVEVKVVTAASGEYEKTLAAEIDKDAAPTLFTINGPVGYQSWKDYCLDLKDTKAYAELKNQKDFSVAVDGGVYGIAFCYEAYGLITNTKLLKEAGYEVADITSFDSLKKICEDITARKDELGFAAFTSAGLDGSSSWRFSGHLANLPLYYEFEKDNVTAQPATIKGTYLKEYKNVWDLYINNSTCTPKDAIAKTGADTETEFINGEAVFFQNGTWEYDAVKAIGDENLAYLPIYFGVDDKDMGLCAGTENFLCVNSQASEADQKATEDFIYWLATSETGTKALAEDMGFVSTFKQGKESSNVLFQKANESIASGKYSVKWCFPYTPNTDAWRASVVDALTSYNNGGDWADVETAFVEGWAKQYQASHAE